MSITIPHCNLNKLRMLAGIMTGRHDCSIIKVYDVIPIILYSIIRNAYDGHVCPEEFLMSLNCYGPVQCLAGR